MDIAQESIKSIVNKASNGEINIPMFQREFQWKAQQVRDLAESLYKKYPIGVILFWKTDSDVTPKTTKKPNSQWIIDGQQRVSSFCILFGEKPYWWPSAKEWEKTIKKMDVMINVETEEIGLSNPFRKKDNRWISFRDVLKLNNDNEVVAFAERISKETSIKYHRVWNVLMRVYYIKGNYSIPTLTIHHGEDEVFDIFYRLNKKGTKVEEADFIKGLIAIRNPNWVKFKFEKALDGWASLGWKFDPIVILRTISAIGKGKTLLKEVKNEFWEKEIDKAWNSTVRVINSTIVKFKEYGILSLDLIPSKNSLIPIFVLYHKFNNKDMNFDSLIYWLLLANYAERYSGSALYAIQKDVGDILKARSFKDAISRLFNNLKEEKHLSSKIELTPQLIISSKYTVSKGKFIRLVLYMIMFQRGARDWITRTKIGYEKGAAKILENFTPEWHHIFPQNILKKYGFSSEDINSVANITVLTSGANKKLKSEPWKYIWEFKVSNVILREHLIPKTYKGWSRRIEKKELKKIWNVKNYKRFLEERASLMAREMNKYLSQLYPKNI